MTTAAILLVLLFWNPSVGARASTPDEVMSEYAAAISDVCNLEEDGRKLTARECRTLAAIASNESRFAPHILSGDCNRQGWRALHKQDKVCDSGKAWGPWQIWADAWTSVSPVGGGDPHARDPFLNALVARRLLLKNPHGWTVYDKAKADVDAWMTSHPVHE
jgi:hypothetical protein